MKEHEWFVNIFKDEFEVEGELEEISFESNELYLDEIDESLIPNEMRDGLPKVLMFETMVFEDHEGIEWIGAIAKDSESKEWLLKIVIRDGETALIQLMVKEN
ncbi:hypothetical protein [Metabacillus endolithicus]|uniref:Uncharacterized protein n=1 Tax=Metabacillus endolithicus TaxID=1535204 RepID=A0ABW5C141_9BACI|nr:hypothetical protein [Metabacillus endolithicus]UPG65532.1 hypothetical protein MVE64_11485 [Metabacillus endolithicus]